MHKKCLLNILGWISVWLFYGLWIIENLLIKMCLKCFEFKYSQFKHAIMLNSRPLKMQCVKIQAGFMKCIFFSSSTIQQAFFSSKAFVITLLPYERLCSFKGWNGLYFERVCICLYACGRRSLQKLMYTLGYRHKQLLQTNWLAVT